MVEGKYIVLFNTHRPGQSDMTEEMGEFVVRRNKIVRVHGDFLRGLLKVGPITPLVERTLNVSLNNGYYSTVKVE